MSKSESTKRFLVGNITKYIIQSYTKLQ